MAEDVKVKDASGQVDPSWDPYLNFSEILTIDAKDENHPKVLACQSTRFFESAFSTTKVLDAFGEQLDDDQCIVLGLASTSDTPRDLDYVLHGFNVDAALPSIIQTILDTLRSAFPATDPLAKPLLPKFLVDSTRKKNAIWIQGSSDEALEIVTSLAIRIDIAATISFGNDVLSSLQKYGLNISADDLKFSSLKPRLRLKNTTRIIKNGATFDSETSFEFTIELPMADLGFVTSLRASSSGDLDVGIFNDASVGGGLFDKISRILSNSPSEDELMPQESGLLSDLHLWHIIVNVSAKPVTWSIAFVLTLSVLEQDVSIALEYDSGTRTFTGSLLFKERFADRIAPHFDDFDDLNGLDITKISDGLNLAHSPQFVDVPNGVPTVVTEAFISYQKAKAPSPSTLWMSATLESGSSAATGTVPAPFVWTKASVDFVKAENVDLSVFSAFELNPRTDKFGIGTLQAAANYSAGSWVLHGNARNIQVGCIADWFDEDINASAMDLLGKLVIQQVDVTYTYDRKVASSFLFNGIIILGGLRLTLYYQYATKAAVTAGKTAANNKAIAGDRNIKPLAVPVGQQTSETFWEFDAYLDTASDVSTIGQILDSIIDDASNNLPPFVRDIEVKGTDPTASLVRLKMSKVSANTVVFIFQVTINAAQFLLAQVSTTTPARPGVTAKALTKRLFRFRVDKLPLIGNLPVVRELPQPFDELLYLWIPIGGVTKNELSAINKELDAPDKIVFKPATQQAANSNPAQNPVVLVQGHHFLIIDNGAAVLDHVFGSGAKAPSTQPVPRGDGNPAPGAGNGGVATRSVPGGDQPLGSTRSSAVATTPSKGTLTKSTPLLSISALSLEYKEGMLWMFVDATVALGPLQFALIGFGIGFSLDQLKLDHMADLIKTLDFQLRGMYVSFDKPPILIAGGFERATAKVGDEIQKSYRGGVGLQIPLYGFAAVGEYAEVTKADGGTYKSVFIYAKLDGPLIDLEFAILKGVRIGFGYNSVIRQPGVQDLFSFPLISDSGLQGSGNNPMVLLNSLRKGANPWVTIKEDNYWLAFGLTVSSFHIVNGTIVALVSIRCNGPIFTLLGNLTAAMPPNAKDDYLRLVYIEILASAEFNFADDCFKLQGALSPASFVYSPFARLHGNMALWTFFGRSQHAGDWVFTLGGYHRKFKVPAHYPPAASMERLGTTFSIGIVRISGGVYFAITPKAVMAGAAIHCELDIGPVFAYLDAAFDAMVQFHPLHYWVSVHVEVGVECDIPLLFFTIHIKIHIGAQLEIEGPEFCGTAYVDFWFFSFSIPFGERPRAPDPIDLATFYDLCIKAGPPDVSDNRVEPEDDLVVQLKMSLEDGLSPMPVDDTVKAGQTAATKQPDSSGAGTKWYVKGGSFKFRISSVFAVGSAWVETEASIVDGKLLRLQDKKLLEKVVPDPKAETIYSLPMDVSEPIESDLFVGITSDGGEEVKVSSGWKAYFITKPMPQSHWNSPKNPPNRLSADKGTKDLQMAVSFEAPPPVLAKAKIPQFNASKMAKSRAGSNTLPVSEPEQSIFLPAELKDTPKTWSDMQKEWEKKAEAAKDLSNAMVASAMDVLGWNNPPPDVLAKLTASSPHPWVFDAALPSRLVSGTGGKDEGVQDGFSNFYLELPRVSAQ